MQENFEDALKAVLMHEGGFVTHPDDPGGATNRGVTLTVFQRHFPGADVDALRGITDGQVANIYHVDYWSACRCDELAAGIDYAVFDQAVNSGPSRSIRWLQQAVDAGVDGVIGPETIRLANAASVAVERMCDERLSFMQAPRGGRQRTIFGRGWARRVAEVRLGATALAEGRPINAPHPPPQLNRTLRLGDTGNDGRVLQAALAVPETGRFDDATDAAVRAQQEEDGLVVDGLAGQRTFRAIGLSP